MKTSAKAPVKKSTKPPLKIAKQETADFLFEIGCEEIPAGMLPGAIKELKVILDKYLSASNLISKGASV
jgi:hypothetical protein